MEDCQLTSGAGPARAPTQGFGPLLDTWGLHTVAELRLQEQEQRRASEGMKEDLRQLVGGSYRVLLATTDSIRSMEEQLRAAQAHLSSVGNLFLGMEQLGRMGTSARPPSPSPPPSLEVASAAIPPRSGFNFPSRSASSVCRPTSLPALPAPPNGQVFLPQPVPLGLPGAPAPSADLLADLRLLREAPDRIWRLMAARPGHGSPLPVAEPRLEGHQLWAECPLLQARETFEACRAAAARCRSQAALPASRIHRRQWTEVIGFVELQLELLAQVPTQLGQLCRQRLMCVPRIREEAGPSGYPGEVPAAIHLADALLCLDLLARPAETHPRLETCFETLLGLRSAGLQRLLGLGDQALRRLGPGQDPAPVAARVAEEICRLVVDTIELCGWLLLPEGAGPPGRDSVLARLVSVAAPPRSPPPGADGPAFGARFSEIGRGWLATQIQHIQAVLDSRVLTAIASGPQLAAVRDAVLACLSREKRFRQLQRELQRQEPAQAATGSEGAQLRIRLLAQQRQARELAVWDRACRELFGGLTPGAHQDLWQSLFTEAFARHSERLLQHVFSTTLDLEPLWGRFMNGVGGDHPGPQGVSGAGNAEASIPQYESCGVAGDGRLQQLASGLCLQLEGLQLAIVRDVRSLLSCRYLPPAAAAAGGPAADAPHHQLVWAGVFRAGLGDLIHRRLRAFVSRIAPPSLRPMLQQPQRELHRIQRQLLEAASGGLQLSPTAAASPAGSAPGDVRVLLDQSALLGLGCLMFGRESRLLPVLADLDSHLLGGGLPQPREVAAAAQNYLQRELVEIGRQALLVWSRHMAARLAGWYSRALRAWFARWVSGQPAAARGAPHKADSLPLGTGIEPPLKQTWRAVESEDPAQASLLLPVHPTSATVQAVFYLTRELYRVFGIALDSVG